MNYWVIKGNPNWYEWDEDLEPGYVETWGARALPAELAPNDRLFLWESGGRSRIIGLGQVSDGAHYIMKPFSSGGSWPLVLEWVCARLGRSLGLPIPNYRQVYVSEALAEEWNAVHDRKIEPGLGFGSQQVASALEFEVSLTDTISEDLRLRVLAFDWWIRNRDRGEKNPNLLWSAETRTLHVIDHDQAAQQEDASLFWGTHLFKAAARSNCNGSRRSWQRNFWQHRPSCSRLRFWTSCLPNGQPIAKE